MSLTKYASFEGAQVLDLKGSHDRARHASLNKLADFEDFRTEDGYLYARIRAISSRVNKNHDGWPSVELAGGQDLFDHHTASEGGFVVEASSDRDYGFSTFLGKPIFVDHHNSNPDRARGVIVDAKLHVDDHRTASLDPYYSSDDLDPEHAPSTWVELLLEVDAKSFPKLAKAIIAGSKDAGKGIDGFSMGCDVERSKCSVCHKEASAPDDYCNHVKMKGAYFDHYDDQGHKTSKRAYENCYGIRFFEISAVFDPADETALLREVRSSVTHEADGIGSPGPEPVYDEMGQPYPSGHMMCPHCSGQGCENCGGRGSIFVPTAQDEGMATPNDVSPGGPTNLMQGPGTVAPYENYQGIRNQGSVQSGFPTKQFHAACPTCEGAKVMGNLDQYGNQEVCPTCNGSGQFPKLDAPGEGYQAPYQGEFENNRSLEVMHKLPITDATDLGPKHQGSVHVAENPLPQSDMEKAPSDVDTLRKEEVCPVCGSSMDAETCDICGYVAPPEGMDNPDLSKAQDNQMEAAPDAHPGPTPGDPQQPGANAIDSVDANNESAPTNPGLVSHVRSDMAWEINLSNPKTSGLNPAEKPVLPGNPPVTDEPKDRILKDQLKPVTSSYVRTASEFIAAAGETRRNNMNHTADSASGAPAVAKPDVNVDVVGVGGVDQASNEEASAAQAQVDVLGIGGTGVEGVAPDSTSSVETGDEHSKNIEGTPTDTWSGTDGQESPVTRDPFPASADGVKASSWLIHAYEDGSGVDDGHNGDSTAVKGVKPVAEQFGERVDVLQTVTSPENNSGRTDTWSGTDGNGVTKQQDPVTPESISHGESGMEGGGVYDSSPAKSSAHIFAAMQVAELEKELGLTTQERWARAAELEKESPLKVATILNTLKQVKTTKARKVAGTAKLPVLGRGSETREAAVEETSSSDDDSFLFGA